MKHLDKKHHTKKNRSQERYLLWKMKMLQKLLTPNIVLLAGPLYFIWISTVLVTATMQETSTARASPTSRFFCTTNNEENPKEQSVRNTTGV